MSFNPFSQNGIPLENQFRSFDNLNPEPYNKASVHPYTRAHILMMNALESEAVFFLHSMHRHTDNEDLRRDLALLRRIEQQQQKEINWYIPASESPIELAISYEATEVGLSAAMVQNEPDNYVVSALEFIIAEDIDHLYRFANLYQYSEEMPADSLIRDLLEIFPGRPAVISHRHPEDTVGNPINFFTSDIRSRMHCLCSSALEFQTSNFYSNIGNKIVDPVGRALFQEIAQIEEQHLTLASSLLDPNFSWLNYLLLIQYTECYLYHTAMSSENDEQIRKHWHNNLEREVGHLKFTNNLIKRYLNSDSSELYPSELPELAIFFPHKPYLRQAEVNQITQTSEREKFVSLKDAKNMNRYFSYLQSVNGGKFIPSQKIIDLVIERNKEDYRVESEGDHPVKELRNRYKVAPMEELLEKLRQQI